MVCLATANLNQLPRSRNCVRTMVARRSFYTKGRGTCGDSSSELGKSAKFWQVGLTGRTHIVGWGRIGTKGQGKQKEFTDEAVARRDYERL